MKQITTIDKIRLIYDVGNDATEFVPKDTESIHVWGFSPQGLRVSFDRDQCKRIPIGCAPIFDVVPEAYQVLDSHIYDKPEYVWDWLILILKCIFSKRPGERK